MTGSAFLPAASTGNAYVGDYSANTFPNPIIQIDGAVVAITALTPNPVDYTAIGEMYWDPTTYPAGSLGKIVSYSTHPGPFAGTTVFEEIDHFLDLEY